MTHNLSTGRKESKIQNSDSLNETLTAAPKHKMSGEPNVDLHKAPRDVVMRTKLEPTEWNLLGSNGETLLMKYCGLGDYEVVEFLLGQGADPMQKTSTTALHAACKSPVDDVRLAAVLLVFGALPNERDEHNRTPLDWAVSNGKLNIAKRLLAHPGIEITDNTLQYAKSNNQLALEQELKTAKKQQTPKSGWFGKSSPPPPNPLEDDLNTALHEKFVALSNARLATAKCDSLERQVTSLNVQLQQVKAQLDENNTLLRDANANASDLVQYSDRLQQERDAAVAKAEELQSELDRVGMAQSQLASERRQRDEAAQQHTKERHDAAATAQQQLEMKQQHIQRLLEKISSKEADIRQKDAQLREYESLSVLNQKRLHKLQQELKERTRALTGGVTGTTAVTTTMMSPTGVSAEDDDGDMYTLQRQRLENELAMARSRVDEAEKREDMLQAQLHESSERENRLTAQVADLQERLDTEKCEYERRLNAKEVELLEAKTKCTTLETHLERWKQACKEVDTRRGEANSKLAACQSKLVESQRQEQAMASRCQHLEQTLADETTKYEHKLLEQESKFEGQRVAMQTKISVLSSEIDVLKLEMSQAVPIVEASESKSADGVVTTTVLADDGSTKGVTLDLLHAAQQRLREELVSCKKDCVSKQEEITRLREELRKQVPTDMMGFMNTITSISRERDALAEELRKLRAS